MGNPLDPRGMECQNPGRIFLLPFLCLLLLTALIDYPMKRPNFFLPHFAFYTFDHVACQVVGFAGCLGERTFGSYRIRFTGKVLSEKSPPWSHPATNTGNSSKELNETF